MFTLSAKLSLEHTVQLDCYSFAIVLWVLLGWEIPFRNITPMQVYLMHGCHEAFVNVLALVLF